MADALVAFDEIAPILCAGVTVYKGIRVTDTRPGQWLAISGIGGLGHVAVQYAIAMGLHVVAVDISEEKLELARKLGAKLAINANTTDPAAFIQKEIGGAHGVLVTAVSRSAFAQALGMESSDSCRSRRVPTIDPRTVMPLRTVEKIGSGKSPGGKPFSATVPPRRTGLRRASRRHGGWTDRDGTRLKRHRAQGKLAPVMTPAEPRSVSKSVRGRRCTGELSRVEKVGLS